VKCIVAEIREPTKGFTKGGVIHFFPGVSSGYNLLDYILPARVVVE
jgi:hypothetical protein